MSTRSAKRATIKDVAALAGVSHPTASRVLNDRLEDYPLRDTTIERVRDAAQKLDYHPNRAAQSLRNQKSQYIGLSFPYFPPGALRVAFGDEEDREKVGDQRTPQADLMVNASQVAWSRGLELVCMRRYEDRTQPMQRRDVFPDTVDGLVYLNPTFRHQEYVEIAERNFPFVLVGYCPPQLKINSCDVNNEEAMAMLTRHLVERGCRRPLYVYNREPDWLVGGQRLMGFRRALSRSGGEIFEENEWEEDAQVETVSAWICERLDNDPKIDGILFANWEACPGVMDALRVRGLSYPDEILVAGICDGLSSYAEKHRLTCVHLPLGLVARAATTLLIDTLEGKTDGAQHIEVDSVLIERASTKR